MSDHLEKIYWDLIDTISTLIKSGWVEGAKEVVDIAAAIHSIPPEHRCKLADAIDACPQKGDVRAALLNAGIDEWLHPVIVNYFKQATASNMQFALN